MSFNFTTKEFILGNGTGLGKPFQFYRRGFNIGSSGSGPSWQDIILSGNGSLTLTNAKANSLSSLTLFGGCEQRNLPSGYTQLDYIESSGDQIIDLGLKWTYTIGTEVECEMLAYGSLALGPVGVKSSGGGIWGDFVGNGGTHYACFGNKTDRTYTMSMVDGQFHTWVINNAEASIDGVVKTTDIAGSNPSLESTDNIGLFGRYNGSGDIERCGKWRVKYAKIYDSGLLIHHFVPARRNSDNVLGMYDMVSGTFLTNASSGSFTAGPDTVPTPEQPLQIVCNNGALKYSANMANVNEQTALIGYYISSSGVVTADSNNWIYQDYIPVKPNTTYTLTMSSSVYYVTISEYSTADDSGFITRKTGSSGDNTTLTITTSSTTNYIRFGTNLDRSPVTLDRILAINWMLNVGDTMAYQPYVEGGIYTDGTVETVEVAGKNLFDKSQTPYQSGNYISSATVGQTGFSVTSNANYNVYRIEVQPNTTYTFGKIKANAPYWVVADSSDKVLQTAQNSGGPDGVDITITTETSAKYLYLTVGVNGTYKCDDILQLELGSTATTYEPYFNGGTATAELLLKVGDYQDIQSVLDGVVTRNIGIKVLDGTEDIGKSGTYAGSFFIRNVVSGWGTTNLTPVFCTHFSNVTAESDYNAQGECIILNNAFNMWWGSDSTPTAAQFSAWLAEQYANGNPVIVLYQKSTATTESVEGQALTIQAGTNIVEITQASIDNLGLEVSYKGVV